MTDYLAGLSAHVECALVFLVVGDYTRRPQAGIHLNWYWLATENVDCVTGILVWGFQFLF